MFKNCVGEDDFSFPNIGQKSMLKFMIDVSLTKKSHEDSISVSQNVTCEETSLNKTKTETRNHYLGTPSK